MGYALVIAEKRDQATKLANPFEYENCETHYKVKPCPTFPNGAYIAWCAGHIVELINPEAYDEKYKKWNLDDLPIIPQPMKYRVIKSKVNLYNTIKELLYKPEVTEVIIGSDAGREGSLLVYNALHHMGNKKPVKRLWAKSLTPKAVIEAFTNVLPEKEKYGLYEEALARSVSDWLIGMSLTRAYTIRVQQRKIELLGASGDQGKKEHQLISIGRVQSPLLKLIVDRYKAIDNFVPSPYYEVYADFNMNGQTYKGKWYRGEETSIPVLTTADKLAAYCVGKHAKIERSTSEDQKEYAPHLFALSDIQYEANKKFKFTIAQTDDALQELYLAEYISYPRSDSRYLTEQDAALVPMYLTQLKELPEYADLVPDEIPSIVHNKRYTNNELVTDHYAIIITDKIPILNELNDMQRKIYDLIVKRLLAAHYPPAHFKKVTLHTYVDNTFSFITTGRKNVALGWRELYQAGAEEDKDDHFEIPYLAEGNEGIVEDCSVKSCKTKPPAKLSEGDLIPLMKNAGRQLEDQEAGKILNQTQGLGTEATRAGIIKRLIDRNYLTIENNIVYPTQSAKVVVEAMGESTIGSAMLTAEWESKLSSIAEGKLTPSSFIKEVTSYLYTLLDECRINVEKLQLSSFKSEQVKDIKSTTQSGNAGDAVLNTPVQKPATTEKGGTASYTIRKEPAVTKSEIVELFEGVVIRNTVEEIENVDTIHESLIGNCPECEVGGIVDRNTFYGCTNYKMGCRFTLNKMIAGKELSVKFIRDLVTEGKTGLISGFKKKNKEEFFDAVLELKDRKITFKFPNRNALKIPTNLLLPDYADKSISEEQKMQIKELIKMCSELKLNSTLKGLVNSPQVSRFELEPNNMNVNMKKFASYKANFQMALRSSRIAIRIPLPGTNLIGIEVPSPTPYNVNLRVMLEDKEYLAKKEPLTIPLGVDLHGNRIYADIARMPHCLIAGATNSGKSVCINSILISLLFSNTPDEIKLVLIDPKKVELSAYSEIPHLMMPVVTDMRYANKGLNIVLKEMEQRYELMKQMKVKKIEEYNSKVILENSSHAQLPYIVVVIDEFASLMLTTSDTNNEEIITRLVQEARAAGIHLILSTQRPVRTILPTTIKANLPTRLAFAVNSTSESMVVLDENGAEDLLGRGDMLYKTNQGTKRLVSAYISDAEINRVVAYILMKHGRNNFEEVESD